MNQAIKDKLKKIPKKICHECKSKRRYTNPMGKCHDCGGNFCFDHIYGGQVKNDMNISEELRNVCKKCRESLGYRAL